MAVELKTIQHLCELSKLNYDEAGLEKVMGEMGDIIDLMDTIKSFDLVYDDTRTTTAFPWAKSGRTWHNRHSRQKSSSRTQKIQTTATLFPR